MEKVFEPGELELADAQGDPNQAIETQQRIKELLGANRQRQQALKAEIVGRGAWALPGVINSTYVWMSELETAPNQEMLASIMAGLAKGNPAAVDLLFRTGIIETPFPVPRSVARRALELLDWQPSPGQIRALRGEIREARKTSDVATILALVGILLKIGEQQDVNDAINLCMDWAKTAMAEAGTLLVVLVHAVPPQAPTVISRVIGATAELYKDENLARMLLQPLRPISSAWLAEGTLLKVSSQVLSPLHNHRHTAIEFLWTYAVQDCRSEVGGRWVEIMERVSADVMRDNSESVCRYWFSALRMANEIPYIVKQAHSKTEPYAIMATLQLFFERQLDAKKALSEVEQSYPTRYRAAKDLYEKLTTGPGKDRGGIREGPKFGDITTNTK
jgi:hypothetical protein